MIDNMDASPIPCLPCRILVLADVPVVPSLTPSFQVEPTNHRAQWLSDLRPTVCVGGTGTTLLAAGVQRDINDTSIRGVYIL